MGHNASDFGYAIDGQLPAPERERDATEGSTWLLVPAEIADDSVRGRAAKVAAILEAHYDEPGTDPETAVADLLADVRHFCDARDIKYYPCDTRAFRNHLEETLIERGLVTDPERIAAGRA